MPLLCGRWTLMRYFIFFLTTQICSWALHAEKTTRKISPRFIPPTKAAASPPRLVFPTAWTCPMSSPQDLFLPRDFHQFLFFFLWPLLRNQPSLGSTGHHCSSNGRAGAAPQGRSCLRAYRILPAARCHRTDFALGPFLPSP